MTKVRRELKNIPISSRVTSSVHQKIIDTCEDKEISISEYLSRLIKKDLKLK